MQTVPTKHTELNVKVIYEQFKHRMYKQNKNYGTVFCTDKSKTQ